MTTGLLGLAWVLRVPSGGKWPRVTCGREGGSDRWRADRPNGLGRRRGLGRRGKRGSERKV